MERGGREYSIGELADQAGVSTRTIRYYVSEGLLPPPLGAGPNSRYTDAHREQLEIIGRLKREYLPLKEIRRRLAGHGPFPTIPLADAPEDVDASVDGERWTREHWLDVEAEWRQRHLREEAQPAGPPRAARSMRQSAREVTSAAMPPPGTKEQTPLPLSPVPSEERSWRRVAISDEAELLISERQYRRHRDKIDWLAQWAKRVLDG